MLSSVSSWSGTQRGRGLLTKERASPESLRLGSRTAAVSSFLTNLALLHRFDPTTPNSKVVAVWSREKFVPNNNMFIVDVAGNLGKALAVYLNSSFSIAQFLLHKQETTRTLIDIKISDLEGFMAPDPDRIEPTVIQGLARVFDTFSDSTLGSIIEDYTSGRGVRKQIDREVGKILGLLSPLEEAGVTLDLLHSCIADELRVMKEMLVTGDQYSSVGEDV